MTPEEFHAAKRRLGLSWAALARELGYGHGATLRRFARGARTVPHLVAATLRYWLRTGVPPSQLG